MRKLAPFHRVVLSKAETSESLIALRVRPDREQTGRPSDSTATLFCENLNNLRNVLSHLGVGGYLQYAGEGGDGPLLECVLCSIDDIIAFVERRPPSGTDHATLVALDTTIDEMGCRLQQIDWAWVVDPRGLSTAG